MSVDDKQEDKDSASDSKKNHHKDGGNIIEDSDGSILYHGNWTLVSFFSARANKTQTFHTTLEKGANATLDFSGKSIAVYGTIPANNGSEPQPSVNYFIDSQGPFSVTLPHSNQLATGQTIFTSPPLQNGPHSMTVVVTSNNANFTLDFIKTDVTPGPQSSTSGAAETDVTSGRISQRTATIVGGVLGTIVLLMLFLLAFAMLRRRRRIMFVQHFPEPSMDEKPGSGPIERDMQRETRATWTTTVERPTDSGAFGDNLVVDFRYSPRSSHLSDPTSPAFAVPRPRAPAGSSEEKSRWSPVSSTFSRAYVPQSATAALPPPFTASDPRNTVSSEKHGSWIPIGMA